MARAVANAPDAGDILWIDFGAPFGHEQAGRRPALVLSPRRYNEKSTYTVVCPLTRNPAPWPYKVAMPKVGLLEGFVLVDQLRAIDRRLRVSRVGGRVPDEFMARVRDLVAILLLEDEKGESRSK